MPRKKNEQQFGKTPYIIEISQEGDNPDCVHHEIITAKSHENLVGTCKKCGRVKQYIHALSAKGRSHVPTS